MPLSAGPSDLPPAADAVLARLEFFGIKLGLESTRALLGALGDPQLRFPIVLVAGTNGKGSTSALLASILHHAGNRVGLYTSPHLESPRERVRIDGKAVAGGELGATLLDVVAHAERALGAPPTYFEAFTAAACVLFARHRVDIAVLEVGMGGRLDATNACEPLLSVLTPIGYDHQAYLGDSLTAIATEKAGILRAGGAAVAWVADPESGAALDAAAETLGARLEHVDATTRAKVRERRGLESQTVAVATPLRRHLLTTALLGEHQATNVALAVRAAEALAEHERFGIDPRSIAAGVAAARWPGRLEPVALEEGGIVLFDGAHNRDGAGVLERFLAGAVGTHDLLFGALADKDVEQMLPRLARAARRTTLTRVPSPRSEDPARLLGLAGGSATAIEDGAEALAAALRGARHAAAAVPLVVCGSLYLVGALRRELRVLRGAPVAAAELALC